MKTLNIALLALALTAGATSAALALDGPRNTAAAPVTFSDSYQGQTTVATNNFFAQQSEATLALNTHGEIASQHH